MNTDTKNNPFQTQLSPAAEQVIKGWETGYGVSPDEQTGGAALRREMLSDQITMLTYSRDDLDFFRDLPRVSAESTVAQYVQYLSHGEVGHTRATRETGIAPVSDPEVRQQMVRMKFLSDQKRISIATMAANNVVDPVQQLTNSAIEVIAMTIEQFAFYGDADLSHDPSEGAGTEFDGVAKLVAQENVIDNHGKALTQEQLNQAATLITKGYGRPTDAYMPIGVHSTFVNQYLNNQTQIVSQNGQGAELGYNIQAFHSSGGRIALHGSAVMENEQILNENRPTAYNSPQRATVEAKVNASGEGRFFETDIEQALEYKVTVTSEDAVSAPSDVATAAIENTNDEVEVSIQINNMYQARPDFVSVYRKGIKSGLYFLVARIGAREAQQGVITYVDKNQNIPETTDVFVGQMSQDVIHLYEFIPMMRLQLAQIDASVRFSFLWYGALALRAPKRWVRIKNVEFIPSANGIGTM